MSEMIQEPAGKGNRKLAVLDLFSGIGGFSLGLERTGGFETVAFCEIEDYPRRVLAKHWPGVPIYDDVRTLSADALRRDGIDVDVICGGFPCQDISVAGRGAGLAGERSGLWREYARLIRELRPQFVLVENVAALLSRGLSDVLGDLAALGYDAEWHCIPAAAVGAPHRRDRLWIVAHSEREFVWHEPRRRGRTDRAGAPISGHDGAEGTVANATGELRRKRRPGRSFGEHPGLCHAESALAYSNGKSIFGAAIAWPQHHPWHIEPEVGRVVDGVPHRVVEPELKALGNAVVPQIPELIGRAILKAEGLMP